MNNSSKKSHHVFQTVLSEEAIQNVIEVLRSGWIGLGSRTYHFEQEFARFVGAQYCVALNSATSALFLALRVLDIRPGDEVITTPITFVSTNHVILHCGAQPVFADVDPYNGLIDVIDVERKITNRTKAIIVVHLGGYAVDLDRFYELSHRYNIPIIEDAAHACGSIWNDRRIGSTGLLHCFSFHAVKNLPMGDGGAITTNNPLYAKRLRLLRWLGIDKDTFYRTSHVGEIPHKYQWEYNVNEVGYKMHMNDIQAAIGLAELKYLDRNNQYRRKIARIYESELKDLPRIQLPKYPTHYRCSSAMHFYPIFVEKRDKVIEKLKEKNIHPGVHYKRNDLYPMYKYTYLPGAEYFWTHELTLPLHLNVTDHDAYYIAATLKEIVCSL